VSTVRAYGGRSREDRIAQRRTRLLDAGVAALHEDGLAQISVRTVCARAGLTARYFYESFGSLADLLEALVDRVADAVSDQVSATLTSGDLSDDVSGRVEAAALACFELLLADAPVTSLLRASTGHPAMHARFEQRALHLTDLVVAWLAPLSPGVDADQLRLTTRFLLGGAIELATASSERLIVGSTEELARLCARQFVAGWRAAGVPLA
jgi:AcrR family transcriptional regulator